MAFRFRLFRILANQRSGTRAALISALVISCIFQVTVHASGCNPSLYGMSFDGRNGLATLYSIVPINGHSIQLGATGYERISGMDTDPATGITYATAEEPGTDTPVLITIDRATGNGSLVGAMTTVNEGIAGLSIRNNDSQIFAFGGEESFFTVDSTTGLATVLFEQEEGSRSGNSIAFSPGDILYHADSEELHTVDQTTGQLSVVHSLTFNFPAGLEVRGVGAMDYAPESGIYYAIVKRDSSEPGEDTDTYLASVDVGSGNVDHIGQTADSMDGLTYVCEPPDPSGKIFKDGFEGQ